jgi:hypothetical protein
MTPQDVAVWQAIASTCAAIGTFLAVVVALFGDWLRGIWFRPALKLALRRAAGEATTVGSMSVPARYYHLVVSNDRSRNATHVEVLLVRIEVPGPDDALQIV